MSEPRTYSYILFDLDGTLTDPKEGITKSVQHALRHFGIDVENPDDLVFFIGPPLIDAFMEAYGFSEEEANTALMVYRERFSSVGLYENRVYEGVPEMLRELRSAGKKLLVASSKPEPYVRRILDHFALTDAFDEIVGGSMDEKLCAKPEIIREAMRRMTANLHWDGNRRDLLMVGDRRHDVEGAKVNQVDCLGIYTGFGEAGELEKAGADYIVHSVAEMGEFLLSH